MEYFASFCTFRKCNKACTWPIDRLKIQVRRVGDSLQGAAKMGVQGLEER